MPIPEVVYVPSRYPKGVSAAAGPVLVLTKDNWDDRSFKSSFGVYLLTPGGQKELGGIRLIAGKEQTTSDVLDGAPPATPGGRRIDLGNRPFLSLGTSLEYYKRLNELLPIQEDRDAVLAALHDVVYLEHRTPHSPDLSLRSGNAFRTSLLRGTEELSAYGQARQILFSSELAPDRFNFTLTYRVPQFAADHAIQFRFDPDPSGPPNVSVLIGPNGTGKTRSLYAIVERYLAEPPSAAAPAPANFARLVAVSFSPFERFPLKAAPGVAAGPGFTADARYTYCGFRAGRDASGEEVAWRHTSEALAKILRDDVQQVPSHRRPKFASLVRVLGEALRAEKVGVLVELKRDAALPPFLAAHTIVDADGTLYFDVGG
ncbi:MAG TPA: hypothetical protein VGN72_19955 [Tepidisphaeraceae bacterium]|jgi:hypothetical protein|nr:hypothetical protein [Tepidisphaeraceae bacterium]